MTTLGTKYQQAQNWSARLNVARDIWQEVREESWLTKDVLPANDDWKQTTNGPSTIAQGPYTVAQIQDETIVDTDSLSDAELGAEGTALRADALTAPKEGI